jgi:DNA-directed RNA polymerase specialized sigma24 family protein
MRLDWKRAGGETHMCHSTGTIDLVPDEEQVRDVYRIAYGSVGNREEAEELTERILMRAVSGAAARSKREMADLLRRSAATVIEEHVREVYPFPTESLDSLVISPLFELAETDAWQREQGGTPSRIVWILSQLSAGDRDVLSYRFLRNATLAETAAQMHIGPAEVMALQWSALSNAARLMAQQRMIRSAQQAQSAAGAPEAIPPEHVLREEGGTAECAERAPRAY